MGLLGLLAAGYLGALVYLAWATGVTVDEPAHLLSAHNYWQGHDDLKPRDMPPLIKLAGGWVAGRFSLPIPYDNPEVMATGHEWNISYEMINRMNASHIRWVFFYSRLPLLVFPLLALLLLWWWARQLFPAAAALMVGLAFTIEPTALGHGALFKNDLAATFGYLLFWYRGWKYWRTPSLGNAAWLGVGLLIALMAKLSMLVLAPVAVILVLARGLPKALPRALPALALALGVAYLGALAAYQFETRRLTEDRLARRAEDPRIPKALLAVAQAFRVFPLPSPLWEGMISLIQVNSEENKVYLFGRIYPSGHPLYFPAALAVKAPLPFLLLGLAGLAAAALAFARRDRRPDRVFYLLPPLFYIGMASLSSLQLGVRLILPALPFGLLWCGTAIELLSRARAGRAALAGLFLLAGLRTAAVYPHNISFFNLAAGGPDQGLRYLADSNLDWGQDLREVGDVRARLGIEKLRLAYFGTDNPWAYYSDQWLEPLAPPWNPEFAQGEVYQPQPGYYAVSSTLLPGHFFDDRYRDYFRVFRQRQPIAKAGYSIFFYKID